MVSIVVAKNSLTDLVNAGLTVRYYRKKGVEAQTRFVETKDRERFWNSLKDYVDNEDRSLLILNFPLPLEETLKKIDLKPYEFSILNVPSELIAITPRSRKILLKKGIVSMHQRKTYKCFPGEYVDKVERRWMRINRTISFEDKLRSIDRRTIHIARGLLRTMGQDAGLAIKSVATDDTAFLEKAGKALIPRTSIYLENPDLEIVSAESRGIELIQTAFYHFLQCRKDLIGIRGEEETAVLTKAPTFAHYIFSKHDVEIKDEMKSGKGAILTMNELDLGEMCLLMGKLSVRKIQIRFGKPRYVIKKTLKRRLVGGPGPEGRSYRGIKKRYPQLEMTKEVISTPTGAFENVIDTLKETGTDFQIMA